MNENDREFIKTLLRVHSIAKPNTLIMEGVEEVMATYIERVGDADESIEAAWKKGKGEYLRPDRG